MIALLMSWAITSLAVWLTAALLPGFHVRSFSSAFLVAAVFGILNALLGGLFFVVLGLLTLGIGFILAFVTKWIINAILLKIVDAFTDHLKIDTFGWALGGALMISVLGTAGEWVVRTLL